MKKRTGKVTDISIRIRRRDGQPATLRQARAALWVAHKIAQRGGDVERELREWVIVAINWRNVYRSGKEKTYRYTDGITEVIAAMGGIFEDKGLDGLRVEVPDA